MARGDARARRLRGEASERLGEPFWLVVPVTLPPSEPRRGGGVISELLQPFLDLVELFISPVAVGSTLGAGILWWRSVPYVALGEGHAVFLERSRRSGWKERARLAHGPALELELARSAGRHDPPLLKVGRDIFEFPRTYEADAVFSFERRQLTVHPPIDG